MNARLVKDLIRAPRDAGATVLLTTHDISVADELWDRVAFIVEGAIRCIEAPRSLAARQALSRGTRSSTGECGPFLANSRFPRSEC